MAIITKKDNVASHADQSAIVMKLKHNDVTDAVFLGEKSSWTFYLIGGTATVSVSIQVSPDGETYIPLDTLNNATRVKSFNPLHAHSVKFTMSNPGAAQTDVSIFVLGA